MLFKIAPGVAISMFVFLEFVFSNGNILYYTKCYKFIDMLYSPFHYCFVTVELNIKMIKTPDELIPIRKLYKISKLTYL